MYVVSELSSSQGPGKTYTTTKWQIIKNSTISVLSSQVYEGQLFGHCQH